MKIVSVVGARPQFIKVAPLMWAIQKHNAQIQTKTQNQNLGPNLNLNLNLNLHVNLNHLIVHTGQHYDFELSKVFFDELGIPEPDYNLEVGSDTHARQTGNMMIALEDVLVAEKPDMVIVYGDTNSTLAGALAAAKLHIPVAHVEAGPRMFDKSVPEEVNRVLTDHISTLLFAPTQTAVDNLRREGIKEGVYLTGDVMLDSFLHFSEIAEKQSKILDTLGLSKGEYLLATVHRARNTDNRENLTSIIEAFLSIEETIVFPIHPRTRKKLEEFGLLSQAVGGQESRVGSQESGVKSRQPTVSSPESESRSESNPQSESESAPNHHLLLIDPVGYLDSLELVRNARKVLTDSGGLQKEAYFAGVPCITLDEATGWPETTEDGWNLLVGPNRKTMLQSIRRFAPNTEQRSWFGHGRACSAVADILYKVLCTKEDC